MIFRCWLLPLGISLLLKHEFITALQCYTCENCPDEDVLELKECDTFDTLDLNSVIATKWTTSSTANTDFEYSYEDIDEEVHQNQITSQTVRTTPAFQINTQSIALNTATRPLGNNKNATTNSEFHESLSDSFNKKNITSNVITSISDDTESTDISDNEDLSIVKNITKEDSNNKVNSETVDGLNKNITNTNGTSLTNLNIISNLNNIKKNASSSVVSNENNLNITTNTTVLSSANDNSDEDSIELISSMQSNNTSIVTTKTNNSLEASKQTTKSITTDDDDYYDYDSDDSEQRRLEKRQIKSHTLVKSQVKSDACYVIQMKINNSLVMKRGCAKVTNGNQNMVCQSLSSDIMTEDCRICTSNGCNQYLVDYNDWYSLSGEGFWNAAISNNITRLWFSILLSFTITFTLHFSFIKQL